MTDRELEQRICAAVEHAAPNRLESILSSCDLENAVRTDGREKGAVIAMSEMKNKNIRRNKTLTGLATIAAVFVLLVCIGGVRMLGQPAAPEADAVIMLDVNPSISLYVDEQETVLSAEALNAEAGEVLGTMDLKGTSLEVAVNAIIGSLLQKGYLGDAQNAILVSVEDQDAARGEALQQKVAEAVAGAVQSGTLDVAVLSQTVSSDDAALIELANQYGISLGKAALIQEVVSQAPALTFDDLAPMTINDIALIAASKNVSSESVTQSGAASDKAYIGEAEALALACANAGVQVEDVVNVKAEFDSHHGVMIYELEFETAAKQCEYEINAATGEILRAKTKDQNRDEAASGAIGAAAAIEAALAHAGVAAEDVLKTETQMYEEDHAAVYRVEFETAAGHYEYKIDAASGQVLDFEKKGRDTEESSAVSGESADTAAQGDGGGKDGGSASVQDSGSALSTASAAETGDTSGDTSSDTSAGGSDIGEDAALAAALAHAGVEESSLSGKHIERHREGDKDVYGISFGVGHSHYYYKIDASDGTVLLSTHH